MAQDTSDNEKPLDPEAARMVARVRRLMMIASMTTFVAVAVVLGVIGYRVFRIEGRAQPPGLDTSMPWPNGARVISSAMNDEQLALTIETPTGVEVRFFDLRTFKPLGRLPLGGKP